MKRPLQLSLAITLALCGTNALALGLGPARVYSKLNQPLNAEIPVIQGSAGEAEGLLVNLANAEDFERIGLSRSRLHVPLEFAIGKDAQGATVIKVTSKEPVRDSYLDFLVEANWPKGRLLREYTMLLDPPLTAPTRATAAEPAAPARSAAPVPQRDAAAPAPATLPTPARVARSAPKPAPAAKANDGDYGPIAPGETLFEIARANASGSNVNQMMLALLKSNPDAFYKDNINALKRGAILRMPGAEDLKAAGSAQAAAAAVQTQLEDWRGGKASPALVADAGNAPARTVVSTKTAKAPATNARNDDERLQLVPPKAGKDSMAMADRAGSGAGSAAVSTELKSELARARETLTASQQESGELKSRVKALEEIKGKNDRLINLKDSEIAELQQKLKQLQSTPTPAPSAKAVPAPVAAAPVAAVTQPIDKSDIWGKDGAPAKAADTPAETATASSAPAAAAAVSATPAPAVASDPPVTAPAVSTPTLPAQDSAHVAATPATTTPATQTLPLTEPSTVTLPAKPVATATKPVVAPKPTATTAVAEPWYDASWVKPGALGAGALLLALGLLGLRKRKAAADAPRSSIADSFGDSPLGTTSSPDSFDGDEDEQDLIAQLHDEPENAGLHLELLSVYYAKRDAEKFEQQAALMYEQIHDPHQAEWIEAQAMGQELAPGNPLFATAGYYDADDVDNATAHPDRETPDEFESSTFADSTDYAPYEGAAAHPGIATAYDEPEPREPAYDHVAVEPPVEFRHDSLDADPELGFGIGATDLEDLPAVPPPVPSSASADDFGFDLPPLDFDSPSSHAVVDPIAEQAPALDLDDDYFAGEDAVATKLDLAKAYMDMGDPEGARSMLDEVLAEGGDEQQAEARRLIGELS